ARSLTSPEGAFYSALDAETGGDEGGYYVWTKREVEQALGGGDDFSLFSKAYGLDREPNFENERYVLLEPRSRKLLAESVGSPMDALEAKLAPLREKLLTLRARRPAPPRDEKVLTSWNGLMIAAYAEAFRVFKQPSYRQAAERAADYLMARH